MTLFDASINPGQLDIGYIRCTGGQVGSYGSTF
eukprot:CAMPEP_0115029984 /NCGR_PEP_ID=MMETSP0216-20121206/37420_1 /TAXON_ID=223996 /ORGANISM="Protocruzia adherens, Strain Boccale" /LENGTH=32 /DNA_ID= /DNA_START= /DNA_END= /DNA_ORIENTATION=